MVDLVLKWRLATLALALAAMLSIIWPLSKMGSEFMPPLYEGDLLYMPTTLPGLSVTKAKEILQQTDRIIRQFPEVQHVFGKVGRAETATDPAPMMMIETTIMLKPEEEWRKVPARALLLRLAGVDGLGQGTALPALARGKADQPGAARRRIKPRHPVSGADQRLDHADQDPHRHALHRHQDPGGDQDHGG